MCYYAIAPSLGPMTSLQQPITGKVSTTAPGIQPIMSKLLTEIANTTSSTSLSSPAASVGGVEVNTSLAATSVTSGGFQSRVPGMNPNTNHGIGMPPMSGTAGMGPSPSVTMPTGMQQPPDMYPPPVGVGGAPSSAMVGQGTQAQQTQVGCLEVCIASLSSCTAKRCEF